MKNKELPYPPTAGFKVPENYFANFESFVGTKSAEKIGTDKKIASGFQVPQYYFNRFDVAGPKRTPKVVPLFRKKTVAYAVGFAAMLVLALTAIDQSSVVPVSFSTIGNANIESYLENDRLDFSIREMETIFAEEGMDFPKTEFDKLDQEAVFDYLMAHSNEISFINE